MSYTIIIILIAAIIVAGIAATAVQQHNERKERIKREEITRHKNILDETESAIAVAQQIPVSQRLVLILRTRSIKALKAIYEQSPSPEIKQKIAQIAAAIKGTEVSNEGPDLNAFNLPSADKSIIKYIQAVKKLRGILKVEVTRGNISQNIYQVEDKFLEKLQLRVNVETLNKRANEAVASSMQGSARQYLDKALRALTSHQPQDEYSQQRAKELKETLDGLESSVKDRNLQQVMEKKKQESQDLDQLFAPKKKW
ncbi:hypothetical protein [Glaciecola sp. 1036]|uniref:hypothetical protein n=1 Tax=Alteromonadaceae TaxID=72275 RepID=UPI003CFFED10